MMMTDRNEKAAFRGAASLPTPEQVAAQPWRYPQGRIPAEEDDLWEPLTRQEATVLIGKCVFYAALAVASISTLVLVFAK